MDRDGSVLDQAATAAEIVAFEQVWQRHGFGRFAVEILCTGEFVGFTGMAIPADVPQVMPGVEIGWRLGCAHWGRGLARYVRGIRSRAAREAEPDQVASVEMPTSTARSASGRLLGLFASLYID